MLTFKVATFVYLSVNIANQIRVCLLNTKQSPLYFDAI